MKYIVLSILFRYEKELLQTQWNSVRKGAIVGVFWGWVTFLSYVVYCVGFFFGSLLMSYKNQGIFNLSDILIVSNLQHRSIKKQL